MKNYKKKLTKSIDKKPLNLVKKLKKKINN